MLTVERLGVDYGERRAVADCSFTIEAGSFVALIGPNGAGKTSLLRALAGLVDARGRVDWRGRELGTLGAAERARLMAYLPQSPPAHWPLTARDLVALGRLPHRRYGRPADSGDAEAVERAMRRTSTQALADRSVASLSGGELARVQLARALAVEAPVLLVDEPVASLDPYHQLEIMDVLERSAAEGGLVVAVLHDLSLAARFCGRVLLLDAGKLVEDGAPATVLHADALRRYYRVDALIAEHAGKPLIVPWNRTV